MEEGTQGRGGEFCEAQDEDEEGRAPSQPDRKQWQRTKREGVMRRALVSVSREESFKSETEIAKQKAHSGTQKSGRGTWEREHKNFEEIAKLKQYQISKIFPSTNKMDGETVRCANVHPNKPNQHC